MIPTEKELLDAIAEISERNPTYDSCEKLSTFYTLLNHLYKQDSGYSYEVKEVVPSTEGSEFRDVVAGKPISEMIEILDEHMSVIKILFPKEYRAVIKRLELLR